MPVTHVIKQIKTLERYSYRNLRNGTYLTSNISFEKQLSKTAQFASYLFTFSVEGKRVSGLANIPLEQGEYPVVILIRGYVDREIYETGIGTQRIGEELAQHGYITLAPDFLGYGSSGNSSNSSIEERFQTYTTTLTLLASVDSLTNTLATFSAIPNVEKVGMWAHSNGGQIALSALEISGKEYPTVLWAPVSKPFPYSVLYYTDEFEDEGKALRKAIATFEQGYDIQKYSPTTYFSWINAPLQLHQGLTDTAVAAQWSENLYNTLVGLQKDVTYFTYPNADHNLMPDGWNSATARSIDFFDSLLKKN